MIAREHSVVSLGPEKQNLTTLKRRLSLQFEILNGLTFNIFRQKGRFFESIDQNNHEKKILIGFMTFKILILTDFHVSKTLFQTIKCTKTSLDISMKF